MKKTATPFSALGMSSITVIFATLCLTVFAVLTLATVRAGTSTSVANAESVKAYYAADCEAEEILSVLRNGALPEGVTQEGGISSYSCKVSDTQQLDVKVRTDGEDFEILQWQLVYSAQWQADDSLEVWNGN